MIDQFQPSSCRSPAEHFDLQVRDDLDRAEVLVHRFALRLGLAVVTSGSGGRRLTSAVLLLELHEPVEQRVLGAFRALLDDIQLGNFRDLGL